MNTRVKNAIVPIINLITERCKDSFNKRGYSEFYGCDAYFYMMQYAWNEVTRKKDSVIKDLCACVRIGFIEEKDIAQAEKSIEKAWRVTKAIYDDSFIKEVGEQEYYINYFIYESDCWLAGDKLTREQALAKYKEYMDM